MEICNFEIAKKLKEKGFNIPTKNIIAMYNELGVFYSLTTSADYQTCDSGFKCRCYYDYDDFDDKDYIAPTISQVLKWLREAKGIHIDIAIWKSKYIAMIVFIDKPDQNIEHYNETIWEDERLFDTYEKSAIAGVNYCLENLI